MFAGEKFEKYIFAHNVVHVATDHKSFEGIFKRSLCDAPARVSRMFLPLRCFKNLEVGYNETASLELVDHIETLHVSLHQQGLIWKEFSKDQVCKSLKQVIQEGWSAYP